MPISCTRCGSPLPAGIFNTENAEDCPSCGARTRIDVFPALFRGIGPAPAAQGVSGEMEASCFFHEGKKAVVPCEGCGRFLCSLCDIDFDGRHLCPHCVEVGKTKGTLANIETQRVLYDNVALFIAVVPLLACYFFTFVTAPIALYVAIRYWNAPSSIIARTKARAVAAIALACLQIVVWGMILVRAVA
ncbi:MAG: hypothetical protein HY897_17900 [Deltaproteobacteria bacterium]|nr:hypothetical protein [Deltaproteobacteria bacterium]